jgi:HEAT repeat protein
MTIFYCPYCWHEIPENCDVCPFCGEKVTHSWASLSYEEKLINALGHPEPTTVMRAAWLLGEKQVEHAIPALLRLIETTSDVYIILEAVKALGKIDTPESRKALLNLSDHPVSMIRREIKDFFKHHPNRYKSSGR